MGSARSFNTIGRAYLSQRRLLLLSAGCASVSSLEEVGNTHNAKDDRGHYLVTCAVTDERRFMAVWGYDTYSVALDRRTRHEAQEKVTSSRNYCMQTLIPILLLLGVALFCGAFIFGYDADRRLPSWAYPAICAGTWMVVSLIFMIILWSTHCLDRRWSQRRIGTEKDEFTEVVVGINLPPFSEKALMVITANPTDETFQKTQTFMKELQAFIQDRSCEKRLGVPM